MEYTDTVSGGAKVQELNNLPSPSTFARVCTINHEHLETRPSHQLIIDDIPVVRTFKQIYSRFLLRLISDCVICNIAYPA